MDELLDILWAKIVIGVQYAVKLFDHIIGPLEVMGPAAVLVILVFVTVCLTKLFSRVYTTKRYERLKKEFAHYYNLRQEALACEDKEKGKRLARNIDQGKLNKVYYDFFFEGLLKNMLTIYLPVLTMAAYINEAYKPASLTEKFGRAHVLQFPGSNGEPVVVGALFFFVIVLLATYLSWFIAAKIVQRKAVQKATPDSTPNDSSVND